MAAEYCSTHGPRLVCDCESPRMVHQCGYGRCGVEIYNADEMCERHTADTGFLARGGPVNIANMNPRPKDQFAIPIGVKIFIGAVLVFFAWAATQ